MKKDNNQPNTNKLLFEIGVEEIPSRFLNNAILNLKNNAERLLTEYRLGFLNIQTYATPRRLVVIGDVAEHQYEIEEVVWGPPVNAAFDKNGIPTKAADAFARNYNIDVKNLQKKEKGKGMYVYAKIKEKGKDAIDVLPDILLKLIQSLQFPKSMRWADKDFRFVRPIHWILAIYKNRKIEFNLDDIKSDSFTRGHRFLAPTVFNIKDINSYFSDLRNNFVILDQSERKKIIIDLSNKLASSVNAQLVVDEDLIEQISFLVEYPMPVLGAFSKDYLALPEDLLITVMKGYQKSLALRDFNNQLTNHFIFVSNTKQENSDIVRKGGEKVLKARFEDARFYYEEDKKIPLEDKLDRLKSIIYYDKLGSLYQKTNRIVFIADFLSGYIYQDRKDDIHKSALLCKVDLITDIVREFPELQGIMGGYYALNDGYNKDIATALKEQYLPTFSGDNLPKSDMGAILSLSDKTDNIASFFVLGLIPTGREDPFALRRQVIGIILILLDKRYKISLKELFEKALILFDISDTVKEKITREIIVFFEQRLESILSMKGYTFDSIQAILRFIEDSPLYEIIERLDAIYKFKQSDNYEGFLLVIKRLNNIAPKTELQTVKKELFVQQEEIILYEKVQAIKNKIMYLAGKGKYFDCMKTFQTIFNAINNFFDKVLVMDKDEFIRQNRLSLIEDIRNLSLYIADFSKCNP